MAQLFPSCIRDLLGTIAPNFSGTVFFQTELCLMTANEYVS